LLLGTAGLVVAWEQQQQQLAVAGDLAPRLVRLWDVEREMRLRDLPTGSDSCVVTSLAPDLSGEKFMVLFSAKLVLNCIYFLLKEVPYWQQAVLMVLYGYLIEDFHPKRQG
jgi:hypothetical protein